MFRTIIVDDDFLVRTYLKQLDAWKRAGYEIIGDVRDGEEALRLVEETLPDVVVTDISMPLMDGIELIRRIREKYREIYIVVLSCHDDFNYVKEAMKLGANEYVLKNSLDEDSLYELLENASHQMKHTQVRLDEQERTRKLIKMGSHSLKYHFFNQLLSGTMTLDEREKKRQEAGISGKFINSAVINMFIPDWAVVKAQLTPLEADQYSQMFLHTLTEQLELLLGTESAYVEEIYLGEGIFCCFLDLSAMCRSSLMKQKLTSVASACFKCCKQEPYRYAVGVSNICIGEDGIRQAYQQAREMIKLKFYEDNDILYFDGSKTIARQVPAEAEKLLEDMPGIIAGKKQDELLDAFDKIISACHKNCADSKAVVHWLKRLDAKVKIERTADDYAAIIKIEDLGRICEDYSRRLFSERQKEIPRNVSSVIKQALEYIHSHYRRQIGLGDVADAVGVNHAYLSYLFKQEMGIGFSNYLLDCRMECARELLRDTGSKIKDVAEQSGFNDYHYFSKAFKKLNACSPADYRKNSI
ncbi:response regulator [uncultured Robinsoniella sp.]|uniref:response regulator n=1 Tax=uncultured Robinsoniella sp. TaxID=904190 RepID=UPI00374E6FC4